MVYHAGPRGEHVVVVDNKQGIGHVTVGKFTMVFPRHRKLFMIQGHVQVSTLKNNDWSYSNTSDHNFNHLFVSFLI
jgi:uncharacterized cupin superfamily protein